MRHDIVLAAMTVGDLVRAALGADVHDGARVLTLPAAFQGLPGMAHGGTMLALFDAVAGAATARRVAGHYRRRVPLDTPLRLHVDRDGSGVTCVVRDATDTVLVDGRVTPDGPIAASRPPGASRPAYPLPVSAKCFVCGTDNAQGLGARLEFDARVVRGVWAPRPHFAEPDGALAPAALTGLLDETAFWLGALATGESGMTTELAVALHERVAYGAPLTVIGERDRVSARPDDARYVVTEAAVLDDDARVVATARITFVMVRGTTRRLAAALAGLNPEHVVRRVFPGAPAD